MLHWRMQVAIGHLLDTDYSRDHLRLRQYILNQRLLGVDEWFRSCIQAGGGVRVNGISIIKAYCSLVQPLSVVYWSVVQSSGKIHQRPVSQYGPIKSPGPRHKHSSEGINRKGRLISGRLQSLTSHSRHRSICPSPLSIEKLRDRWL